MKKSPLISIIVPVYNSEEYLERTFDTVINQDFDDYELILVNDGSTDNSPIICQRYAEKYNRVHYYTKENGGLCSARNYGLTKASGQYIMFMDNDDEYCQETLKTVAEAIVEYKTEIIRFNRKRIQIFDDGTEKIDIFGTKGIAESVPVKFNRDDFFGNYKLVRKSGCFAGIWNAAFKRDLFNTIQFDEDVTAGGEDLILNIQLYDIFKDIVFLPDVLYLYYRRTRHSISTTFQVNQIYALGKAASHERNLVKKNSLSDNEFFSHVHIYLASIVKVLTHKNSHLSITDKFRILDSLCQDYYGFQFTSEEVKHSTISFINKAYLYFYTNRHYIFLFQITRLIMKIRGNA